jgi:hypothetical protein
MNIVLNPSFALTIGWTFTGPGAKRTTVFGNTDTFSAALRCQNDWVGEVQVLKPAIAYQRIPAQPGHRYELSFWYYQGLVGTVGLRVEVNAGYGWQVVSEIMRDPQIGPEWIQSSVWPVDSVSSAIEIRFVVFGVVDEGGFNVDDVSLDDITLEHALVKRRDDILNELVVTLKRITGTAYWNDVGGRVYRRDRPLAEMDPNSEFPALFVYEAGESSSYTNDDQGVETDIHALICGVCRETSQDPLVTTAATTASKLHDDVCRALLGNERLSGKLQRPLLLRDHSVFAGVDPDFAYLFVTVTLPYYFFYRDLGPLAQ